MKKIAFLFLFVLTVSINSCCSNSWSVGADSSGTTVYVTKSGSCYHKISCSTIKNSKTNALSESVAKSKGYKRCSICKP